MLLHILSEEDVFLLKLNAVDLIVAQKLTGCCEAVYKVIRTAPEKTFQEELDRIRLERALQWEGIHRDRQDLSFFISLLKGSQTDTMGRQIAAFSLQTINWRGTQGIWGDIYTDQSAVDLINLTLIAEARANQDVCYVLLGTGGMEFLRSNATEGRQFLLDLADANISDELTDMLTLTISSEYITWLNTSDRLALVDKLIEKHKGEEREKALLDLRSTLSASGR